MIGIVKWFDKGYGFIEGFDGTEYFVHHSQIQMDGFRSLDQGDHVEFDIRSEEKGMAAVDVVPVLTLKMMKDKARKEHLHLEEGITGWMIENKDNFIVAGESGMSLEELYEYFRD